MTKKEDSLAMTKDGIATSPVAPRNDPLFVIASEAKQSYINVVIANEVKQSYLGVAAK